MKETILKLTILATLFLTLNCQEKPTEDPKPQGWADAWQMPFEDSMLLGWDGYVNKVKGMFYYDFTKKSMRVERESCRGDRFGGNTRLFDESPCHHIITSENRRYIYWPERKHCCYCCGAGFCSVLKPNWIPFDSDFVKSEDGLDIFQARSDNVTIWQEQTGLKLHKKLRSTLYEDGVYLFDSNMTFDTSQYKAQIDDPKIFDLPTDSNNCNEPCPQRFCFGSP